MKEKIYKIKNFSLNDTIECGQVFRFTKIKDNEFNLYSKDNYANLKQDGENLIVKSKNPDYFEDYFDLKTDYNKLLKGFDGDEYLEKARKYCGGIRILRQDKWEALASFILSSNNNIKRIKGIIERFCSLYGEEIEGGYAFPTYDMVSKLNEDDLKPIRAGFRDKYLLDSAKKVKNKEVDLEEVDNMEFLDAKESLKQIKGVGDKVAECVLLFGFHRMEAFPIDVWMKKVLKEKYPNGLSEQLNSSRGLAQQILYHMQRIEEGVYK